MLGRCAWLIPKCITPWKYHSFYNIPFGNWAPCSDASSGNSLWHTYQTCQHNLPTPYIQPQLGHCWTHYSPVTPQIDIYLGQLWLRLWLVAPSHYLNQYWLVTKWITWHSPYNGSTISAYERIPCHACGDETCKITSTSPKGQWMSQFANALVHPGRRKHSGKLEKFFFQKPWYE